MSLFHALLICLLMAMTPLSAAQSCQPDHQLCSPEGAISDGSPVNLSSSATLLADFYEDLVYSVDEQPSKRYQSATTLHSRSSSTQLCCTANTQCLLLERFFVAFCWDRFTTNYYMPDGSYGNIVSGIYTLASGKVNLLTGNFTLYSSGRSGDLYGAGQSPQTSTLPMPTPWTSTGEGTAIPASEVGETSNYTASSSMASHTTTLPVSDVPTFTSNPAPTETRTATVIHGNAARSVLGGLSEEVLLVALVVCLVSTQHCHYETYHSV